MKHSVFLQVWKTKADQAVVWIWARALAPRLVALMVTNRPRDCEENSLRVCWKENLFSISKTVCETKHLRHWLLLLPPEPALGSVRKNTEVDDYLGKVSMSDLRLVFAYRPTVDCVISV